MTNRYISWFSCGAASAVATHLALKDYGADNVEIVRQDTGSEHPDNERFMGDCEEWFGKKVRVIQSDKYPDIWSVFEKRRYIVGVAGAPCTSELKRIPGELCIEFGPNQQIEVFGYTVEEKARVKRWIKNNNERLIDPILVRKNFTKNDCLGLISKVGIEIPTMYKLGYRNNNCIGCVKGQAGYWNKIRVDFPAVFERMALLERGIGAAINKTYVGGPRQRVFLDELDPNAGRYGEEPSIQCGIVCMDEVDDGQI